MPKKYVGLQRSHAGKVKLYVGMWWFIEIANVEFPPIQLDRKAPEQDGR